MGEVNQMVNEGTQVEEKVGLGVLREDDENFGEYRVEATVFVGSIQKRQKSGKKASTSNVVKSIGYKMTNLKSYALYEAKAAEVEEIKTALQAIKKLENLVGKYGEEVDQAKAELREQINGRTAEELAEKYPVLKAEADQLLNDSWLYLEKLEAIHLAEKAGVVNAKIRARKQNVKDDQNNVVTHCMNLNLHPKRGERPFTDEDRLCPVFAVDHNGKVDQPSRLVIDQSDCSDAMWKTIQEHAKTRSRSNNAGKTYSKISESEKAERIKLAMEAANFEAGENPFNKRK